MKRLLLTPPACRIHRDPDRACSGREADRRREPGLSKGSVFDVPTPQPFTADGKGASGAREGGVRAPPLVPHAVDDFLPMSSDKNDCVGCHDKPGGKKAKGAPTPMPALHYAKTAEAKPRLSGDYYNCGLCHAPAADVKDIVGNRATKPAR
jgi:cytochrome c-type protein NapB